MKNPAIVIVLIVLATCVFSVQAQGQYLPDHLRVSRGKLVSEKGHVLSDREVFYAIGEEIYEDTYEGARRQYRAGSTLITVGSATLGVSLATTIVSGLLTTKYDIFGHRGDYFNQENYSYYDMESRTKLGYLGFCCAILEAAVGFTTLTSGVVFYSIGRGRLGWVADNYNLQVNNHPVIFRLGEGEYGTGLIVNF